MSVETDLAQIREDLSYEGDQSFGQADRSQGLAALDRLERHIGVLASAAKNVLEYLDGMEIPFKDQHRPLQALHAALAPFTTPEELEDVGVAADSDAVGLIMHDLLHPDVPEGPPYVHTITYCDYCSEGNVAVDGWHDYPDPDLGGGYRVPCAINPPKGVFSE